LHALTRAPADARAAASSFAPLLNGCWTLAGGHGRISQADIMEVRGSRRSHALLAASMR
jgi:hypothetical protein